jgi:rod shape determining protein RodA
MERSKNLFSFDPAIFISMLVLMVLGVMFIYSSGISSTGEMVTREYLYQILWALTGLAIFFALLMIDYSRFRMWSVMIYSICLVLLVVTLLFGKTVNGSRSWLGFLGFGIQPSEFSKIAVILLLARYFESRQKQIGKISTFLVGLGICMVPVALILLQPDLGTATVFFPIFLTMAFLAGTKKRYVFFVILYGSLTILLDILPVWELYFIQRNYTLIRVLNDQFLFLILAISVSVLCLFSWIGYLFTKKSYFYWMGYAFIIIALALFSSRLVRIALKDYQIMRLIVFIDPSVDPLGAGWNVIQSVTAVGSGGIWGKGFLQGTQSHYRFLPMQSTDFIFSILAEELGFFGSMLVIILYVVIMLRGLKMVSSSKDMFGVLVICGIVGMMFFHMTVNIGMAIGIMPITGIPLFLVSYGGSSLWTILTGFSIMQNIYIRRYRY